MNKKQQEKYEETQEDIVFEEENVNDTQIVKKLRAKLRACEKEKKEYLDGWQRAKADLLNSKKEAAEKLVKVSGASKEALASELLPVLDSFDMAFKGEAWTKVDDVWQKGVEYIHTQLLGVLSAHGVEQLGKTGENFDILLHEASEERDPPTDSGQESGTILEVLQSGYKTKDSIIRPARVVVSK